MKIIIGGDICPININENHFKNNQEVFCDLQNEFKQSDLNIVNLEVPLTDATSRILKSGPNIKGPVFAAKSLNLSNVHVVSLANNHIGDFSSKGVLETIDVCTATSIKCVGAGADLIEARKPLIINAAKKRIGIISMSDTEFGIATNTKAGVNPLDICEASIQLINLKENTDYNIVILHEGKEHYKYPSPNLQKICRYLCDIGADLVVCQHSHICGAWESYKDSNIFYGQGNLMFDHANRNSKNWNTGYLIKVELEESKVSIKQIPFKQTFPGIAKLNKEESEDFFEESKQMSKNVLDQNFIEESWGKFIQKFEPLYFSVFKGYGRVLRKLNSIFPFAKFMYSKKSKAILLNAIRSRVHREVVIDILEKEVNGK